MEAKFVCSFCHTNWWTPLHLSLRFLITFILQPAISNLRTWLKFSVSWLGTSWEQLLWTTSSLIFDKYATHAIWHLLPKKLIQPSNTLVWLKTVVAIMQVCDVLPNLASEFVTIQRGWGSSSASAMLDDNDDDSMIQMSRFASRQRKEGRLSGSKPRPWASRSSAANLVWGYWISNFPLEFNPTKKKILWKKIFNSLFLKCSKWHETFRNATRALISVEVTHVWHLANRVITSCSCQFQYLPQGAALGTMEVTPYWIIRAAKLANCLGKGYENWALGS